MAKAQSAAPPEVEAFLAILRATEKVQGDFAALFKRYGLSDPSYNVLRILRGARPGGLPCGAICDRLVTRVPDVTRLVDRLGRLGLVDRHRSEEDRRVVTVKITRKGLETLSALDEPVLAVHRLQFAGFSRKELGNLRDLLAKRLTGVRA